MPADTALWRSDQLEAFSLIRANESARKLTQGRVEEICFMRNTQLQLALMKLYSLPKTVVLKLWVVKLSAMGRKYLD